MADENDVPRDETNDERTETDSDEPLIYHDTQPDAEEATDLEHLDPEELVEDAVEFFTANPSLDDDSARAPGPVPRDEGTEDATGDD